MLAPNQLLDKNYDYLHHTTKCIKRFPNWLGVIDWFDTGDKALRGHSIELFDS